MDKNYDNYGNWFPKSIFGCRRVQYYEEKLKWAKKKEGKRR